MFLCCSYKNSENEFQVVLDALLFIDRFPKALTGSTGSESSDDEIMKTAQATVYYQLIFFVQDVDLCLKIDSLGLRFLNSKLEDLEEFNGLTPCHRGHR